ncbi:MAG: hypothetical protein K5696_00780 [Lachnospiraceae bacterium]|nr:hypothetical protein [Lachnospiraceae bacterium]
MLTMIILFAVAAYIFRVLGFGLRVFGKIIGWLIGMAIVFSIIGGMFGLIGAVAGLAVKVLPVAILVGIGILIGRSLSGRSDAGSDFRYRAQDAIDGARTRAQDLYNGVQTYAQDIVDANGRVIR